MIYYNEDIVEVDIADLTSKLKLSKGKIICTDTKYNSHRLGDLLQEDCCYNYIDVFWLLHEMVIRDYIQPTPKLHRALF